MVAGIKAVYLCSQARKQFDCNKCGGLQEHPVSSKCKLNNKMDKQDDHSLMPKDSSDINSLILSELKGLSSRMTAMVSKVNSASYSPQRSHIPSLPKTEYDVSDDDFVFHTVPALKQSKSMQNQVDEHIRQLVKINKLGKFRSQRGGAENVWVEHEVPWSQNYILGDPTKQAFLMTRYL